MTTRRRNGGSRLAKKTKMSSWAVMCPPWSRRQIRFHWPTPRGQRFGTEAPSLPRMSRRTLPRRPARRRRTKPTPLRGSAPRPKTPLRPTTPRRRARGRSCPRRRRSSSRPRPSGVPAPAWSRSAPRSRLPWSASDSATRRAVSTTTA
ncbi:hypothetical protein ACHAWF_006477 [Thalassiosira exigua]